MAGTTKAVKRAWLKTTALHLANSVLDPFFAFFTQINNLVTDIETLRANYASANTLLTQLRTKALYNAFSNPAFAIKTNFDVQNANAVHYTNGGTLKLLAAAQTFDTGTAQVIAADKWSSALLTLDASGNPVVTWSATLNAASEAAAIAALPAIPANSTVLGYITVLTGTGVTWTAGTDALAGGAGGTPATTTNYYNSINPNTAFIGSAVTGTVAGDLVASALTDTL